MLLVVIQASFDVSGSKHVWSMKHLVDVVCNGFSRMRVVISGPG